MKKIFMFFCVSLSIALFSLSSVYAQQLKIGVFNMQQIMQESKVVQGYRATIEKEIGTKKSQLAQKQEWIRSIEEKMRKDDKTISPRDRRVLSNKLDTETRDLRRMKEEAEIEFQRMDRELTDRTMGEVAGIINNLAKTEGYALIFERSSAGIAYMEGTFDITAKIITLYDAKDVKNAPGKP
jgi:outer membrane protein